MGLFNFEDKFLKRARKQADKVEALRDSMMSLSNSELAGLTEKFRKRYASGESLDELLPEVFAQVREASRRVLGMEHFYVQILGGIILHNGDIAEMKTGEGKTLAATLPVCLNALTGKGVHVVTVNEYLAKRDSEWMGKLYEFLGYTVGITLRESSNAEKRAAYLADITYGTNNEFGFDYLRDNMKTSSSQLVQRELQYAIVDEVDSILIDEARTPLIISGEGDESTDLYSRADTFVRKLKEGEDFEYEEKDKNIMLTEEGVSKAEEFFGIEDLSDLKNTPYNHHIIQALKANYIFKKDTDYIVRDGEIIIVDEFTGRLMIGRRYSEGLHQAIEAKEHVKLRQESKTLATITLQNYFRMYEKLAGMTGTAKTEEKEFEAIYDLAVVQIPTNKKMIRIDRNDEVFADVRTKYEKIADEIARVHEKKQPILVGTVSVEKSEIISSLLIKRGIKHEILNAKNHEKEAYIIAQAGRAGAVTIATNMAGRGTDIILGGNPDYLAKYEMKKQGYSDDMIFMASTELETDNADVLDKRGIYKYLLKNYSEECAKDRQTVLDAGGLYILGTERHESRRIDNQLIGRSGRQGDPGESVFFISFEDDLMRLFGGDRVQGLAQLAVSQTSLSINYRTMSKLIESAQKRIEERNFNLRSRVLKYDDVMNEQREVIYGQRRQILFGEDTSKLVLNMKDDILDIMFGSYMERGSEDFSFEELRKRVGIIFDIDMRDVVPEDERDFSSLSAMKGLMKNAAEEKYHSIASEFKSEKIEYDRLERYIVLKAVDEKWEDHIDAMDELRKGIGLRSYGQTDPVVAYQKEGFDMFEEMVENIKVYTVTMVFHINPDQTIQEEKEKETTANYQEEARAPKKVGVKIGRNDPCPCGSGKKYKNCHGRNL